MLFILEYLWSLRAIVNILQSVGYLQSILVSVIRIFRIKEVSILWAAGHVLFDRKSIFRPHDLVNFARMG